METADFLGKKVGLLGAGRDNLAIWPWLKKWGARPIVGLDQSPSSKWPADLETRTGPDYLEELADFDLVLRSPGLPLSTVLIAVAKSGRAIKVTSAIDLFINLGLQTSSTLVGVTGSKGKGTTATMLGAMLTAAGRSNEVVGNIGRPVFEVYETLRAGSTVVIELSSFQLEDITASPNLAIILPIFPEHLAPLSKKNPNFHSDLATYTEAKANICRFQNKRDDHLDAVIFASDNPQAAAAAKVSPGYQLGLSTFDSQAGLYLGPGGSLSAGSQQLVDFSKTNLTANHLRLDGALAAAAARHLGVKPPAILAGLQSWQPLAHRMETVAVQNGLTFIDDSYATVPEATIAALTVTDQPIILIVGGSDKGANFQALAEAIKRSTVKAVVAIGGQGPAIVEALRQANWSGQLVSGGQTMKEIVGQAKQLAESGEVVLLSPAAASLDMFKDAADRGDQFRSAI